MPRTQALKPLNFFLIKSVRQKLDEHFEKTGERKADFIRDSITSFLDDPGIVEHQEVRGTWDRNDENRTSDRERTNIHLNIPLRRRLEKLASERGTTMAHLINQAITRRLQDTGKITSSGPQTRQRSQKSAEKPQKATRRPQKAVKAKRKAGGRKALAAA